MLKFSDRISESNSGRLSLSSIHLADVLEISPSTDNEDFELQ
jgi:hypothetical protein